MVGFKKFLRVAALAAFAWLIVGLAITTALIMTFNSPDKIKKALSESGVYSTFVDGALAEVKKSTEKHPDGEDVPINDPSVQEAAKKAFTPQLLQNATENMLDGTYDWLSGKSKTPTFNVDLTQAKNTFAESLGAAAAQKVAGLPPCTSTQLRELNIQEVDFFSLPCQPPSHLIAEQQAKLVNQIKTSKDFLGNPVFNAQSLPKDKNGKTVFENASKAPDVYKFLNASPWLLGVLAIAAAAAAILLSEFKRRGWRSVGLTLGITGILILLFNWAGRWNLSNASKPGGSLNRNAEGSFQQIVIKGIDSISASVSSVIVWFALGYLLIATIILAVLYFTKPKQPAAEHKKDTPAPKANKSTEPTAKKV